MSANGRLPAAELVSIGDGLYLPTRAGEAFNAAKADGALDGAIVRWDGAYRSIATQKRMQGGDYPNGVAGVGGSVHGEEPGAVDIFNWADFGDIGLVLGYRRSRALDRALKPYGFTPDPRYPHEPWHYRHNGLALLSSLTNPHEIEDPMILIVNAANKTHGLRYGLVQPGLFFREIKDPGSFAAAIRQQRGLKTTAKIGTACTDAEWDIWKTLGQQPTN